MEHPSDHRQRLSRAVPSALVILGIGGLSLGAWLSWFRRNPEITGFPEWQPMKMDPGLQPLFSGGDAPLVGFALIGAILVGVMYLYASHVGDDQRRVQVVLTLSIIMIPVLFFLIPEVGPRRFSLDWLLGDDLTWTSVEQTVRAGVFLSLPTIAFIVGVWLVGARSRYKRGAGLLLVGLIVMTITYTPVGLSQFVGINANYSPTVGWFATMGGGLLIAIAGFLRLKGLDTSLAQMTQQRW